MNWLVTGGCGFIGVNLADALLRDGEGVTLFDSLYREGAEENLAWVQSRHRDAVRFVRADIRDAEAVAAIVKQSSPDVIAHLAGQVAMTTSLANPRLDFEVNAGGTLNVLEAVRNFSPGSGVLFSSTNKVYGDLEHLRIDEQATRYALPDHPYGLRRACPARRPFALRLLQACRRSVCPRLRPRLRTEDRRVPPFLGVWRPAVRHLRPGLDRVVLPDGAGGGPAGRQAVLDQRQRKAGEGRAVHRRCRRRLSSGGRAPRVPAPGMSTTSAEAWPTACPCWSSSPCSRGSPAARYNHYALDWRKGDQKVFVADIRRAEQALEWRPNTGSEAGVRQMLEWMRSRSEHA